MRTPEGWTLVLTLLALGCLIGVIAGRVGKAPRKTRLRLLNKPQQTGLPVLVPSGPAPRLVPGDAPNATRPHARSAPISRHAPAATTRVDYIAAFADSGKASEEERVDHLIL